MTKGKSTSHQTSCDPENNLKSDAPALVIFVKTSVLPQVSLVSFVRRTSMTVCQSLATMVCVKMGLPLSRVNATLDTQAPFVIFKSRSATAAPVRTEDAALTSSMPTSVTALQEPTVSAWFGKLPL